MPAAGFTDTEFMPFRSDYILASNALAACSRAYGVVKDDRTHMASDHYPIWADFMP